MNKDLLKLKENCLADFLARDSGMTDREKVDAVYPTVIPGITDGCLRFTDIDYPSNDRFHWSVYRHLERTLELLIIARRADGDTATESKLLFLELLNEWVEGDYIVEKNENMNRILVPELMSCIALLAWEWLDGKQRDVVDNVIRRGVFKYNYNTTDWTGPELMRYAGNSIRYAVLIEDEEYLKNAVARMYEEVDYKVNAVQKDGSFQNHGRRLYTGGYGRAYYIALVDNLTKLEGTSYALPKEKAEILENLVLNGMRWMSHRNMFDWAACGHEFSRIEWGKTDGVAKAVLRYCTLENASRIDELRDFAEKTAKAEVSVNGVKFFGDSDIICAHIDDAYIGFKGISPRTITGDFYAWECAMCYNMSYGGTTTVMKNGDEYAAVTPLWNYCRIPGTTTIDQLDEDLNRNEFNYQSVKGQHGEGFDAGQLDDCAWQSQTLEHDGTHATVVCFATPYGVALFGNGLKNDKNLPLTTTLEQCKQNGKVTADDKCAIHNGIKYIVLDDKNKLLAKTEHRTGGYHRTNITQDDVTIEGDIFELTLAEPCESYVYLIQPETQTGKFEALVNTENVQALRIPDGRILVHFFADGECVIDGKTVRGSAHECRVL